MRPDRHLLLLLALSLGLAVTGCARDRSIADRFGGDTFSVDTAQILQDDHARNATPQLRTHLPERSLWSVPRPPATFWIRKVVTLRGERTSGVYVSFAADVEIFWDGERVGGGRSIDHLVPLSGRQRTAGPHLLAIRVQAGRDAAAFQSYFYGIALGNYEQMARSRIVAQLVPVSGLGAFLVIGFYFASMWIADRRRTSAAVFALLCFVSSLLVVAETWRWLFGYTHEWHVVRLQFVTALTFAIALLLPMFFIIDYGLQHRRRWAAVLIVAATAILLFPASYDTRCLVLFELATAASSLAIVTAARRRGRDVAAGAIGMSVTLVALIANGYDFSDRTFFLAFTALIVCLLASLAIQSRRQRREHENALLRAARLEIELLKKSIQPHFVMNTLAAAIEWVEQSPAEGVRLLEALADELRIFAEVASERTIPLRRELELCRSHLAVMSGRKGTRFELDADVDREAAIPPAIFHTLLENAITHNRYGDETVVFTLREERRGAARSYVLDAPMRTPSLKSGEGVGLRYVRARLEESFPGRWSVDSAPTAGAWRTVIEVAA